MVASSLKHRCFFDVQFDVNLQEFPNTALQFSTNVRFGPVR